MTDMDMNSGFKLIAIVAYSDSRVIGESNRLPWRLPNDLQHFKNLTLNQRVLMGRKTYESIGRPLPQREMIVLTRNPDFHSKYARLIHSVEELFPLTRDLYVIGGGEIYRMLLSKIDLIHATEVHTTLKGDAYFPELSKSDWKERSREPHPQDEKHAFAYDFVLYQRLR
jgi:dihydrofolate reductase